MKNKDNLFSKNDYDIQIEEIIENKELDGVFPVKGTSSLLPRKRTISCNDNALCFLRTLTISSSILLCCLFHDIVAPLV